MSDDEHGPGGTDREPGAEQGTEGGSGLTIAIVPDTCCAMGRCAATEPDLFDQDPDTGTVVLLDATPAPALHASARLCAELCPCGAITVTES
ncbi:ferredoxin [Streptomyces sp. NPDC060011]|uniref:ferredoxin n=1 Tax=Streptomyces sp. NPDC060011 TaxID=3347037 RepID=UPI00368A18C0